MQVNTRYINCTRGVSSKVHQFGTWLVLKMLVTADSDNKMDMQKQVVSAKLSKMVVFSTVHI